ncbi:hypothetical protein RCL_jg295.t1 [Rhizophagus clarus]|uniref:Uncharacterized protein n=1 Tax=Rhizophagus clarus TaxID=94130 RepID=A0A8H3M3E4_9GLOM|nr:hypothetical protein RCL_jg295.t1 [Rhizophagus clarus]
MSRYLSNFRSSFIKIGYGIYGNILRWWILKSPVEVYYSVELEALRGHSCAALWRKAYCERPSLISGILDDIIM